MTLSNRLRTELIEEDFLNSELAESANARILQGFIDLQCTRLQSTSANIEADLKGILPPLLIHTTWCNGCDCGAHQHNKAVIALRVAIEHYCKGENK